MKHASRASILAILLPLLSLMLVWAVRHRLARTPENFVATSVGPAARTPIKTY